MIIALPAPVAWRPMLLKSACGGDATCLNCTIAQAEDACIQNIGCIAIYEFVGAVFCDGGKLNKTRKDDWAMCSSVLGPTTAGNGSCFICRGPSFACS